MRKEIFIKAEVVAVVLLLFFSFGVAGADEYNCLCTKCNHDWVSATKPSKCPNCGYKGITCYKKSKEKEQEPKQAPQGDLLSEDNHEGLLESARSQNHGSAEPISCNRPNAVKPVMMVANDSPCPGGVYCKHDSCGEYCCEWGYFYSNPCDCRCYRSSYDAGANCSSYFRCN